MRSAPNSSTVHRKVFVCLFGLILLTASGFADTIVSFVPAASGPLPPNPTATAIFGTAPASIIANGWYNNGTSWTQSGVQLWGRNETNDHGLGMCNPNEQSAGTCGSGPPFSVNGDANE